MGSGWVNGSLARELYRSEKGKNSVPAGSLHACSLCMISDHPSHLEWIFLRLMISYLAYRIVHLVVHAWAAALC